jgi:hypothetical protein
MRLSIKTNLMAIEGVALNKSKSIQPLDYNPLHATLVGENLQSSLNFNAPFIQIKFVSIFMKNFVLISFLWFSPENCVCGDK